MPAEERVYTQSQHEMLVAVARVETLQCISDDNFKEHVKDNEDHFERLYTADKKILAEISLIPERMTKCSEQIKTETLTVARNEFVSNTEHEKFKGLVSTGSAEVKGSLKTTYIVMGVFQSVLLIFLAAWLKTKGV